MQSAGLVAIKGRIDPCACELWLSMGSYFLALASIHQGKHNRARLTQTNDPANNALILQRLHFCVRS